MENKKKEEAIIKLEINFGKPVGIKGKEESPIDFKDPIYKNVEKLILDSPSKISSIKEIDQLPNLTSLSVIYGGNFDIGESIDICRLKELHLFYTIVPKSINKLDELEKLVISKPNSKGYNSLKKISSGDLSSLRSLYISSIKSKQLPKYFGGKNLRELIINRIYDLDSFPKKIFKCSNLETLELDFNGLNSIPKSIKKLKNLKYLNLRCNRLKNIPLEIGELKNLETLDIDCNDEIEQGEFIQELPYTIGNLKKLKHLLSYTNKGLKDLPDSLKNLENLRIYDFKNCPLTEQSKKILKKMSWAKPRRHESFMIGLYDKKQN